MAADSISCPAADDMLNVVPIFQEAVREFRMAVSSKKVNLHEERDAKEAADIQFSRLKECCDALEKLLESEMEETPLASYMREVLNDSLEKTSNDVTQLEWATNEFEKREKENKNSESYSMWQFLSPRTKFAKAWEMEENQGRSEHPESNFLVVILVVFAVLVGSALVSAAGLPRWVLDLKSFGANGIKTLLRGGEKYISQVADKYGKTEL